MSLPEIPRALWTAYQSTIFGEKADQVEAAESFRWGVDDALATLPESDGMDWEAEARRLEEEQQRRQFAEQQQIEAQARRDHEDYQRILDERSAASRANELSRSAPPEMPYDARQMDQGAWEAPAPQTALNLPPLAAPASFADTANGLIDSTFNQEPPKPPSFAETADGLMQQAFGPEDARPEQRYEYAGTIDTGPPAAGDDPGTQQRREPGFLERAGANLRTIGDQVGGVIDTYGAGRIARDVGEQADLERESRAGADPADLRAQLVPGGASEQAWREANPEKATRLDELRESQESLVAGASGTMGGGGLARDAVEAIKALRAARVGEDVILAAERHLAEGADMALSAVQKLTRGAEQAAPAAKAADDLLPNQVENPFPLTAEERALNEAADARARRQPAHGGYLEDPSFGAADDVAEAAPAGPQPGERIRLPDGTRAVVEEAPRTTNPALLGETTYEPPRMPPPSASGGGTPPTPPRPPAPPGDGPSLTPPSTSPPPDAARRAAADYDKILAERQAVASGRVGRTPTDQDVQQVLNTVANVARRPTDRRAVIGAIERRAAHLKGAPLSVEEMAWAPSRLYEGRADVSYARAQRVLQPALEQVPAQDRIHVDALLEQLDNADVAHTGGRDASRQFSGGASGQEVDAILGHLAERLGPERARKVTDAADAVYRFRDEMRDRAVQSGVWDAETANAFKRDFPHYVPTRILEKLDEKAIDNLPVGGRMFSVGSNGVMRLTEEGTTAARQSPLQSVIDMAFRMEDMAQRNTVMQAVAGWGEIPGMEHFVRLLKGDEGVTKGWTAMSYFKDGVKQRVAVIDPLAGSLDNGPVGVQGILGAALNAAKLPLQLGATGLRPAFIFTNMLNDALWTLSRFAVESRNPAEALRGFTDLARGYHARIGVANAATRGGTGAFLGGGAEAVRESGGDQSYDPAKIGAAALAGGALGLGTRATANERAMLQRAREAGASMGIQTRFDKPADIVRQLAGEHIWVRTITRDEGIKQVLKDVWGASTDVAGLAWARPLGAVGEVVEGAPRTAAFYRAERQGLPTPEAAMKQRRVSADFAAGSRFMKQLNSMTPFVNAATQFTAEAADVISKNPRQSAALMATIVSGIVATEIYNRSVAPEDNKDVSQFTKDTGLYILSDQAPQGAGKRGLVFIPLRGMLGALVPLTRAAMSLYYGDDPRTWQQMAVETGIASVNAWSPVQADIGGLTRAVAPPLASLASEVRSNYDAFRDQPIVSKAKEGLPVSEQYDDRTSQAARHLSRSTLPVVGGTSPLMIDYAVKGFSPGPGEALLGAADAVIRATGNELPSVERNVPKGARDVPVVGGIAGRVLRTVGSERQNRAYELADQIAAKNRPAVVAVLERNPDYQRATPDRQKQMLRSAESALQEQAEELAGVPDFKKPKDLGLPARFIGVPIGSRLESEIVSALGTPKEKRTVSQIVLAERYKDFANPLYRGEAKEDSDEGARIRNVVKASVVR